MKVVKEFRNCKNCKKPLKRNVPERTKYCSDNCRKLYNVENNPEKRKLTQRKYYLSNKAKKLGLYEEGMSLEELEELFR